MGAQVADGPAVTVDEAVRVCVMVGVALQIGQGVRVLVEVLMRVGVRVVLAV